STRRRSANEFVGSEPRSQTLVKPQRVSISCILASSSAADAFAAFAHAGPVKCTWLFQKPATTALPAQSITRAPFGTCTASRAPTAEITPSDTTTTASTTGVASEDA